MVLLNIAKRILGAEKYKHFTMSKSMLPIIKFYEQMKFYLFRLTDNGFKFNIYIEFRKLARYFIVALHFM